MSNPLQIGITGGIGSGKSFICNIFRHLNIPIYDADSRAKWLMAHNDDVKQKIIEEFGSQAYDANGLNRKYLASEVFNSSNKVKALNAIVHPAVGTDYLAWANENADAPYLIKEAALMFESGSYKQLDKIVYVHAPIDLRVERVKQRDPHRSETEIRSIISKQLSADELRERSDYVIENDEKQMLLPQIIHLHEEFC